jgi:hypothetical protein
MRDLKVPIKPKWVGAKRTVSLHLPSDLVAALETIGREWGLEGDRIKSEVAFRLLEWAFAEWEKEKARGEPPPGDRREE